MQIKLKMHQKHALEGLMFVFPWIIGCVFLFIIPMLQSVQLSFSKITKLSGFEMQWIGWEHYKKVFITDVTFIPLLVQTITNTLVNTPIILIFSLFIAILVNRPIRCKGIFRAVFFLPVLIGSGYVLKQLLGMGVVDDAVSVAKNYITPDGALAYLGSGVVNTLNDFLMRVTLIFWKSGVQIVLFLAALQGISPSLYESAKCDSATEWEMFWKITLPLVSPVILLNFIYTLIDSFTDVSNPLVDYILSISLKNQQFEYSAAIGWIYFLFVFMLAMLVFYIMKKFTYNVGEK